MKQKMLLFVALLCVLFLILLLQNNSTSAQSTSGVDLVWEASSYTPDWYRGKALFTAETTLTFTALPNFGSNTVGNPSSQIYTWEVDGVVLGNRSGLGQNTLTLRTGLRDESFTVIVEVKSPESGQSARKRVVVERGEPLLRVYEKDPLSGILSNSAVTDEFVLTEEEVTFTSIPFFFNTTPQSPSLEYSWRLDGNLIEPPQRETTFRKAGGEGRVRVSAFADNRNSVLIEARELFEIMFTDENVF